MITVITLIQVFLALTMTDPHYLGYGAVEIPQYSLGRYLGHGTGSFVFAAEHALLAANAHLPAPMFVKVCKEKHQSCAAEHACLRALQQADPSLCARGLVPKALGLLRTTAGCEALLLSPVAARTQGNWIRNEHFLAEAPVTLGGSDFGTLVDVVQAVHAAGWAHRDIKPGNILHHSGHVMLADFDSAVELDQPDLIMWRGNVD